MVANHLESEFSESFKTLSKKFFFDDGFFNFFSPKMVPFHDFPRNPPKSMKNKGKLSKTNVFPLFSLILTKNHEMAPSFFGLKKI